MNIAILHYHLNRGGVTQVIANHLRALDSEGTRRRVVVLYGGRKEGWPTELLDSLSAIQVELRPIPRLDYDQGVADPVALANEVEVILAASKLDPDNCVLHIHNHSLGKNVSLPGAIDRWARHGYRQLLQIHDFAEDFRPHNYRHLAVGLGTDDPRRLSSLLYPQRDNVHYAVLNGRDYQILTRCGMEPYRLHRLPNPVASFPQLPDRDASRRKWTELFQIPPDRDLMLYPVRGIRRKNLGESLLWSLLAEGQSTVAVSLAPLNPLESPIYRHWVQLAASRQLPVLFDIGGGNELTFLENLSAADAILTTSVAEGFGMVYLEAWLAGRPLIGRDLPEITADFRQNQVDLDHLKPSLRIPVAWIGKSEWQKSFGECFQSMLREYGLPERDKEQLDQQIRSLLDGELVDFAQLNCRQQTRVIERLSDRPGDCDSLRTANPWISDVLRWRGEVAEDTIDRNRSAIEAHYSLEVSGERLSRLYEAVASSSIDLASPTDLPRQSVLESFLDIQRLTPLRLDR